MVLTALVAVTLAAVFANRALRSEGTVVGGVLAGPRALAECPRPETPGSTVVSFELARDDEVTVEVVRAGDRRSIATLVRDRRLEGETRHCLSWQPAESVRLQDRYRLRFRLDRLGRSVVAGEDVPAPRADGGSR